jgi:hypothetical protein
MKDNITYDALVVTTPADYQRVGQLHHRLAQYLPVQRIRVLGSMPLAAIIKEEAIEGIEFLHEDEILPFADVKRVVEDHLQDRLQGQEAPRGIVGWYYQQFLKLEYAKYCRDAYYMTWDGDTVPCKSFSMFSEQGVPYLDMKREYNQPYFDTIARLFCGMTKVVEKSFISEHMLFQRDIVLEMLEEIEHNSALKGNTWWEKVIYCIPPEIYTDGCFSEFETYGTYVAYRHPEAYRLRSWNSFRYAAYFLDPSAINDATWTWLGKDFDALSFEKNQAIRSDYADIFDNPRYQEKLSARQVLELAQEEFTEGYKEVWD